MPSDKGRLQRFRISCALALSMAMLVSVGLTAPVQAQEGISLDIRAGSIFGINGRSGAG